MCSKPGPPWGPPSPVTLWGALTPVPRRSLPPGQPRGGGEDQAAAGEAGGSWEAGEGAGPAEGGGLPRGQQEEAESQGQGEPAAPSPRWPQPPGTPRQPLWGHRPPAVGAAGRGGSAGREGQEGHPQEQRAAGGPQGEQGLGWGHPWAGGREVWGLDGLGAPMGPGHAGAGAVGGSSEMGVQVFGTLMELWGAEGWGHIFAQAVGAGGAEGAPVQGLEWWEALVSPGGAGVTQRGHWPALTSPCSARTGRSRWPSPPGAPRPS